MFPLTATVRVLLKVTYRVLCPRLSPGHKDIYRHFYYNSHTITQPVVSQPFGTLNEETQAILDNFDSVRSVEAITYLGKAGYCSVKKLIDGITVDLLRRNRFEEAVDFTMELAKKGDVFMPQRTYRRLVERFIIKQKSATRGTDIENQLFSFVNFMNEQGYKPNAEQQYKILKMASLVGNRQIAQVCFHGLHEEDDDRLASLRHEFLLQTYINEARLTNTYDNIEEVHQLFLELVEGGLDIHETVVKMFIENSIRSGASEEPRQLLKRLKCNKNRSLQYLDLLVRMQSHISVGEIETALEIAAKSKKFRKSGVSFIDLHRDEEEQDMVSLVLERCTLSAESTSSSSDITAVNPKSTSLVNIVSDRALETLCQFQKSGQNIRKVVNLVLLDLFNDNQVDVGLVLMMEVVEKKLVEGCIYSRTYTEVLKKLIESMKVKNDVNIENQFYSLLSFMDRNGYKTNSSQHFCIMQMSALVGKSEDAQTSFDELKSNWRPNRAMYKLLIQAYVNDARQKNDFENMEIVLRYFNEMIDNGYTIHHLDHVMKILIENSVRSGYVHEAQQAILRLTKNREGFLRYLDLLVAIRPYRSDQGLTDTYRKSLNFLTLSRKLLQTHRGDFERFLDLYSTSG